MEKKNKLNHEPWNIEATDIDVEKPSSPSSSSSTSNAFRKYIYFWLLPLFVTYVVNMFVAIVFITSFIG